jgi:NitT/TauT family transport system permease protein
MLKKIFTPFRNLDSTTKNIILLFWVIILMTVWFLSASLSTTHMFPTPTQVFKGLGDVWSEGLITQLFSSLSLCFQAIFYSVIISMIFAYLTTIAFSKSLGTFLSKLRYLPPTGIAFYVTIMISDARQIQVWVLVIFMSTFLITSLIQMIQDIPDEEFDHAKTLGCNRWEMLLEVVIKGRLDYVIELVRQNLAIVWVMLVTIESILVAAGGLGVLIKNGDRLGSNGRVIAVQAIIILIGIVLDFLLTKLRKLAFRYSNY